MRPLSRAELRAALVPRKLDDHKGVFGHLLIMGGSRGMAGAAALAARAALRSGVGLVTAAVPESVQSVVAGLAPEALTLGLPETPEGCLRAGGIDRLERGVKERRFAALALGPGLSTHPETARLVEAVLRRLDLPVVIDADGLNILAKLGPEGVRALMARRGAGCALTPHIGEAARLLGVESDQVSKDREGSAKALAELCDGVAVLKGHGTLISDGRRTVKNPTGGPGLAKGGSGDVLTGLVAGLWAQIIASERVKGDGAFLSAALGAYLHGLAGELAEKELTPWAVTAQDVVEFLPRAFKKLC